MGMFREVRHPSTGRLIQFKTGNDFCEVHEVGDKIDWKATVWNVGRHPDDVYDDELWYNEPNPAYVVIKDLTIVAVVDFIPPNSIDEDDLYEARWAQKQALHDRYGIGNPDKGLWPQQWWDEKEAREKAWAEEREAERARDRAAGIDVDSLGYAMAAPIRRNLDYAGVARMALVVDPLADGAQPVQERVSLSVGMASKGILDKIKKMAEMVGGGDGKTG